MLRRYRCASGEHDHVLVEGADPLGSAVVRIRASGGHVEARSAPDQVADLSQTASAVATRRSIWSATCRSALVPRQAVGGDGRI